MVEPRTAGSVPAEEKRFVGAVGEAGGAAAREHGVRCKKIGAASHTETAPHYAIMAVLMDEGRDRMKVQLSLRTIQSLCGQSALRKGEALCRAGKVTVALQSIDETRAVYEAAVRDGGSSRATVEVRADGTVAASCACSLHFAFDKYCKHVAAALRQIMALQQEEEDDGAPDLPQQAAAEGDLRLVSRLLDAFRYEARSSSGERGLIETRRPLAAEFIVAPYTGGSRSGLLGIELKVGEHSRYVVPDIREFLRRFEQGEVYDFSRHFTYDPGRHCFGAGEDELLRLLLEVRRSERLQREAAGALYTGEVGDPRTLPLPPAAWERLAPKLADAPYAKLKMDERAMALQWADALPVRFVFEHADSGGCQLVAEGVGELRVMEAYGLAIAAGKLVRLKPEASRRLTELQAVMKSGGSEAIRVPQQQLGPFMERVVPGLMQLGEVRIAPSIADRVMQAKLAARVYLDRVRDRLLAGLEFQYGDIVINPLEDREERRGESRILIREGERELQILGLMEASGFVRTESGYIMQDEESEYEFLYRIVPQLEQVARIYATSAVKERIYIDHPPPRIEVDADRRTQWLEFKFRMDDIPETEIREVIRSLVEKRKYHLLPSGALLPLETEEMQRMVRILNDVGLPPGERGAPVFRLPLARGIHLLESGGTGDGGLRPGRSLRMLLEHLRHPAHLEHPVPEQLAAVLRDYQREGYQWMKTLAHYGLGGILADDMGLGKTLQSIAYLVSVLPEIRERREPALIVAPASLLYNWLGELRRFAPELQVAVADGGRTARHAILDQAGELDAVIVSYPLLRRDVGRYTERSFHTLILDEAQMIKNEVTQAARAVKAITAAHRFALTGTPIENRLEELWSIMDAAQPGLFPDRKAFGELSREQVARLARPFLLRRMKREVLTELPEKIESVHVSELLPEQRKRYAAYLAKLRHETLKHLDEEDFAKSRIRILAGLTRLRQLCCHPGLFLEDYTGGSAKLDQLLEIVDECGRSGRRLLIFSQFTGMLQMIGRELGYRGVPYFYLDGGTPPPERVELCDRYNAGERDVFLISMKAGGTGLNLTGADTVVLYDLWWNPAVEQQAEDRAHRIGQKRVVQVIRLLARGTVEEKMYELQQKKKALIAEIIEPGEGASGVLTEQDVRDLLDLEPGLWRQHKS
ncbi:SNF2 helicase associated domain-containing protein [Paenibacillus sp. 1P07SE]|uniref:DEAD/DEAH box helicase n=1 Tax=Paenibacillus sp. 1P07SE TaxID=3132209 RepID=UPI0039A46F52